MPGPYRTHEYGDLVGPNQVKFIKWAGKNKDGKSLMVGECIYPGCHETFITTEYTVFNGSGVKYCKEHSKQQAAKKAAASRRKHRCIVGEHVDANDPESPILLRYLPDRVGEDTTGEFLCQQCGTNVFIRTESHVVVEHSYFCEECTHNNRIVNNTDYHPGEIVNVEHNILWLEEYERTKDNKRYGRFKNLNSGIEFTATLLNVLSGNSVYNNNKSKGETVIQNILDKLNVAYETEKSFDGLYSPNGRKLRYDFYIEELNLLIEYDGIQHFQPSFRQTDEQYRFRKECDKLKDDFAAYSGYTLVRIPYTVLDNHQLDEHYILSILTSLKR